MQSARGTGEGAVGQCGECIIVYCICLMRGQTTAAVAVGSEVGQWLRAWACACACGGSVCGQAVVGWTTVGAAGRAGVAGQEA